MLFLSMCSIGLIPILPSNKPATSVNLPFLDTVDRPFAIAYLGYPGCSDVCPTSLALLAQVQRHLESNQLSHLVQTIFVNVELGTPPNLSMAYAQHFHSDFRGYSVKYDETSQMYKELSARTYSETDNPAAHTGYLYLFANTSQGWQLNHVFFELPTLEQLLERIPTHNAKTAKKPVINHV